MELRKPDGVTIIGLVILLALVGFIVNDFVFPPKTSSLNAPASGLGKGPSGGAAAEAEQTTEVAVPQYASSKQKVQAQPEQEPGLLSAYPAEKRVVPGGQRVSESIGDYN